MALAEQTRSMILAAGKQVLLAEGFAGLSTRRVAEMAEVPLSQIHYHFGSRQNLILAVLEEENRQLLERQASLFETEIPLWKQWEQACDYLEDDLASGYVRVLQEMTAAGWSNDEIAAAVRANLGGWFTLLGDTAARAATTLGGLGPFTPDEIAALAGTVFLGVEAMILLGFSEEQVPGRAALRKVGALLRALEEPS